MPPKLRIFLQYRKYQFHHTSRHHSQIVFHKPYTHQVRTPTTTIVNIRTLQINIISESAPVFTGSIRLYFQLLTTLRRHKDVDAVGQHIGSDFFLAHTDAHAYTLQVIHLIECILRVYAYIIHAVIP